MKIYDFKYQILKSAIENQFIKVEDRVDGTSFAKNGLFIIASVQTEQDNKQWVHVSFSRQKKLPSYKDLILVKNTFIGKNKKAIQIFPEEDKHVNIMPYCLHLWHCLDEDPLPDFTHGKNTL